MDINCPYCREYYELDDLLLPEGDIKVKCRICSNIFILNKNTGVSREGIGDNESQRDISGGEASEHPVSDDSMQSIMSKINSAVAEENVKQEDSLPGKSKISLFKILMLIILIVLFLIAAASALVHYNIINIPFLPSNAASFLSSL